MKYKAPLAIAISAASLVGCSDNGNVAPVVDRDPAASEYLDRYTEIYPGESSSVITTTNSVTSEKLIDLLQIVDYQYPNGRNDSGAPEITSMPARIDAHVALHGSKSDYLDNDAACDTLAIYDYESVKSIGALSLGNPDDAPIIMWPLNSDNEPGPNAYLCFFEDNEPSDGVVIFTKSE